MSSDFHAARLPCGLRVFALQRSLGYGGRRTTSIKEEHVENLGKAAVAEFIGTFALIFFGAGAIIMTQNGDLVAIALAHGLAIAIMVSIMAHISGGVFNPAIQIALVGDGQDADRSFRGLHRRAAARRRRRRILPQVHRADARLRRRQRRHPRRR